MDQDLLLRGPLSQWIDFKKKSIFLIRDCWGHKLDKSFAPPRAGFARAYWQAMMAAPPRDPILAHVISFIVANIRRHYYAEEQPILPELAITGPRALGLALATYEGKDLHRIEQGVELSAPHCRDESEGTVLVAMPAA